MGVVDGSIHWNGQNNFFDFTQFHAERLGMTREEYIAHYGTANAGIAENNKKPGPDPYHRGLEDGEVEDKEDQIKKQAEMDDDDPDAYKEMPGDKEAREKGEVKTSKATKAYNKLYGEDLDEGVMSNIHLMADASKDWDDFLKKFKKDYKKVFQNTPDFMDWLYGMYKDMAPEKVEESKVNEMAMGYDGHTGLFYMKGVPFTQERLEQALKFLKNKVKLGKLPKQFSYYPALQVADNVGMEMVTLDLQDIKKIEDALKRFKGKLAHDGDFDEEIMEGMSKSAIKKAIKVIDQQIEDEEGGDGEPLDNETLQALEQERERLLGLMEAKVTETQKMNKKDWKKIKPFNKHITKDGEKFVMSYDDRIGTFLEPVEIVDESLLGKVRKEIGKTQTALKKKWAKKGGYENFGQDEIRKMQDEYGYSSMIYGTPEQRKAAALIDALDQWAMSYVGESTVNEAFKFGQKKQYSMDDINSEYGFWGTLEIHMDPESIEEIWHDVWGILTKSWKFSDAGALYYLNAKAGRHLADKVYNDINSQISQPDAIDIILSNYARPSRWKAWSKEYNEFAQEEMMSEANVNEADDKDQKSTDRGPLDDEKIETALKKKAEDTGVPIGIIRAVMRRGLAAWKSGHRPGANQQQWGYARVNAFLTKGEGTWGKADKDLAKEVRDGGHDKNLKKA